MCKVKVTRAFTYGIQLVKGEKLRSNNRYCVFLVHFICESVKEIYEWGPPLYSPWVVLPKIFLNCYIIHQDRFTSHTSSHSWSGASGDYTVLVEDHAFSVVVLTGSKPLFPIQLPHTYVPLTENAHFHFRENAKFGFREKSIFLRKSSKQSNICKTVCKNNPTLSVFMKNLAKVISFCKSSIFFQSTVQICSCLVYTFSRKFNFADKYRLFVIKLRKSPLTQFCDYFAIFVYFCKQIFAKM